MYYCSNCHLAVIVLEKEVIKACTCDASIIAEISAVTAGKGGVKG